MNDSFSVQDIFTTTMSSNSILYSILYSIERVSESYQLRLASKFGFQGNSVPLSSKLSTELIN
jgi:hypothetical protein